MNAEVFIAVLAALVVYRMLSPLIDAINPLAFLTRSKKSISAFASAGGNGNAARPQ